MMARRISDDLAGPVVSMRRVRPVGLIRHPARPHHAMATSCLRATLGLWSRAARIGVDVKPYPQKWQNGRAKD